MKYILVVAFLLSPFLSDAQKRVVDKFGKLNVSGNYIVGERGDTVQLRGMSLFWSQWMGQYYTPEVVKWLKDDWKCTVIRAAMGVEMGGYATHKNDELKKITTVVDAAIAQGIYVIIDYHSHEAHENVELAKSFFSEMAARYHHYPNVIYEIYNEPLRETSWENSIKPYSEAVVKAIREHDPDNLIIIGTRQWSQLVNEAALNPLRGNNLVYSLHFYPGTHKEELRIEASEALKNGIALFVSEMGTCDAMGNEKFSPEETRIWWDFLDKHKISWCNWSIADKEETASALKPSTSTKGGWKDTDLTLSGKLVKAEIVTKNASIVK